MPRNDMEFWVMLRIVSSLLKDRSGNFSMMLAMMLVPVLIGAGMLFDFSQVSNRKAVYMAAADAAAVGALSTQSVGVLAAINSGKDGTVTVGEADAEKLFKGQLRSGYGSELTDLQISIKKSGTTLTSVVDFTISVPTTFASLVHMNNISVKGSSSAVYDTGSFIDFYMLLDNTPSMGVGATEADIATMERYTPDSCAFACHDLSNSNSYYNLAKSLKVKMRIDTVREATQQLTQTASSTQRYSNQFGMAVYTFGASATDTKLTRISDVSYDMNAVRNAASAIDLMTIPYQNYNNDQTTDLDDAFKQLNAKISKIGTGASATDRQPIIFFVSDGLTDSDKGSSCTKKTTNGTRCQEPIDYSNACTTLKKRGVKIAVLYTTYLPLPKNDWYNTWIKPFQSQIATNMQACASPGFYFEVSPSEGISDAMNALFKKVVSTPRLSS